MPKNPESLAELLRELRTQLAETPLTQKELAESFNNNARKYRNKHSITNTIISQWENNEVQLYYWQLELYANHFNVPTGLLLIISRLNSALRDGKADDARKILKALLVMAEKNISLLKGKDGQKMSIVDRRAIMDSMLKSFTSGAV